MKTIYTSSNTTEAHIIAGLLKSNDIEAHVGGHYLQGGVGDLAAMDFVTISVADENVDAATSILHEYEKEHGQVDQTNKKATSINISPLFILAACVILMLLLAMANA